MTLRPYQQRVIDDTLAWFRRNPGSPCIEAPTGAGKSWIIAGFCKFIMDSYPKSRVLILSHVKELLQQDAEKLLTIWPEAPLGIYSAGLNSRNINAVTVAGIQSVRSRAAELGKIDAVFVDEAHLINNTESGTYRKLLAALRELSPNMRVIGLTATPYRLGQGMLTEGDNALFSAIIPSVSIAELVDMGYLAPLRSKFTNMQQDTSGVKMRMGDFVESELQAAVDTDAQNAAIAEETIRRAEGRRAWLVFAAGVEHALRLRDSFRERGVSAETVTGSTPRAEREEILSGFKAGKIRCVTNANVLTTGFDYPDIDVIVMARPTMSPGLYMQMAGRGMRLKSGDFKDCLVLDFAGNVSRHGPITAVEPPRKKGSRRKAEAPAKTCPQCGEILLIAAHYCPCCGHIFERKEGELRRHNDDIMGGEGVISVGSWRWSVKNSRKDGTPMIRVDFYDGGDITAQPIPLYLCLCHEGYARRRAEYTLSQFSPPEVEAEDGTERLEQIADAMNKNTSLMPKWIRYQRSGKYKNVIDWGNGEMPI